MRSIGLDLEQWVEKGLLQIHASRPTLHGLEQHLVSMHDMVREFRPSDGGGRSDQQPDHGSGRCDVKPTLMRLIDFLKKQADHGHLHQPDQRHALLRAPTRRSGSRR